MHETTYVGIHDRLCILKCVEDYVCMYRCRQYLWICIVVEKMTIDVFTCVRKEKI